MATTWNSMFSLLLCGPADITNLTNKFYTKIELSPKTRTSFQSLTNIAILFTCTCCSLFEWNDIYSKQTFLNIQYVDNKN